MSDPAVEVKVQIYTDPVYSIGTQQYYSCNMCLEMEPSRITGGISHHSLILKTLGGTGNEAVVNSNRRLSCTKLYHSLVLPHKLKVESGLGFEVWHRGAGAGPASTAAVEPMLKAKLMNLIKGQLQKFWLSNNFSVKFTRSCTSAASPDQSWYASDATVTREAGESYPTGHVCNTKFETASSQTEGTSLNFQEWFPLSTVCCLPRWSLCVQWRCAGECSSPRPRHEWPCHGRHWPSTCYGE